MSSFASPVARTSPSPDDAPQQTSTQFTVPSTTSTLSSSMGFGDLFKAPVGWSCDVSLVQNKSSDTKCVCCMNLQPSVWQESSSMNSWSTTSFGTMFSKPAGTWDCDTCLVLNKPDAVKCVACETAKPGTGLKPSLTLPPSFSAVKTVSNPTAPITTGFIGFGDKFKKPEGAWKCNVCLVQNKSSDTKCVCCMNPQPSVWQESSSMNSTSTTSFGTMFSKPAGTWDCDTCLVLNKPDAVKCVACETAKPGTGLKPSLTLPSSFSAVKTVSNPTAPIITGFIGFGDKFKKPEGAWECEVCLVQNKSSDTKCVCCMNPQPSVWQESSSMNSTSTTSLGSMFSKPAGTWDCDTCLVLNKPDAVKCVACETAKPGTGLKPSLTLPPSFSAVKTVSNPTAPITTGFIGFGDKFKKPEGAWECDTCMVQNKAEDTKCVACMSAKDSTAPVFGLGDKFKKEEGSWDCDVCLLQNKAADVQCVACQVETFSLEEPAESDPRTVLTFRTDPSIAPQAGTPGGGFNFPQPRTFLIGSTESFTASPAGQQTIVGRKIKIAVRRRK
ncbi:nuclear pore complex protein Nup153-like [Thunnus maccoyii]|uniref:nuclear pore complex protein Nup153-like n=1 Tax=Thunnus maccoyii TaxID=8240 RepID=UPI001C4CF019|nr:nuclear pore complex protein Nup153-like [Thunnus maccoyii]